MKTILGTIIPETTRGILYLCELHYHPLKMLVFNEKICDHAGVALELYANIPNPASQLVTGETYEQLIERLELLHANLVNEQWLDELTNYL